VIHPAGVCDLCFWHEMETHLSLIWEGLKMAVCGCCWSWNLSGTAVLEPEVRGPGSAFPVLLPVFPVACSFRNLCSQLHYNFLAKKYKTQLNFNHVNSYKRSNISHIRKLLISRQALSSILPSFRVSFCVEDSDYNDFFIFFKEKNFVWKSPHHGSSYNSMNERVMLWIS